MLNDQKVAKRELKIFQEIWFAQTAKMGTFGIQVMDCDIHVLLVVKSEFQKMFVYFVTHALVTWIILIQTDYAHVTVKAFSNQDQTVYHEAVNEKIVMGSVQIVPLAQ